MSYYIISQHKIQYKITLLCQVVSTAAAHIHSLAVADDGRCFAWGCGSDGRLGLRALMGGPAGAKRARKCYVSTPSAVEAHKRAIPLALSHTLAHPLTPCLHPSRVPSLCLPPSLPPCLPASVPASMPPCLPSFSLSVLLSVFLFVRRSITGSWTLPPFVPARSLSLIGAR